MPDDSMAHASWAAAAESTCGFLAWLAQTQTALARHGAESTTEIPPPEACIAIFNGLGRGNAPEARLRGAGLVVRSYQECYGRISAASIECGLDPVLPALAPAALLELLAPPAE